MNISRIEAFSDAVFAIAITLLVLGLHAPTQYTHLGHTLLHLWPSYVAYIITALVIGSAWVTHHSMFSHIKYADRTMMFINMLLLIDITFLPFPTEVVAHAFQTPGLKVATVFYGSMATIGGLFFLILWEYATRHRELLKGNLSVAYMRRTRLETLLAVVSSLAITLLALVAPKPALVLFAVSILSFWRGQGWRTSSGGSSA